MGCMSLQDSLINSPATSVRVYRGAIPKSSAPSNTISGAYISSYFSILCNPCILDKRLCQALPVYENRTEANFMLVYIVETNMVMPFKLTHVSCQQLKTITNGKLSKWIILLLFHCCHLYSNELNFFSKGLVVRSIERHKLLLFHSVMPNVINSCASIQSCLLGEW
jgi:hypothetical protein